jgi:hypothetical protein
MILDASRRRAQGPWTRARLVVPGMRSASAWRLAGQGTPAGRLAVCCALEARCHGRLRLSGRCRRRVLPGLQTPAVAAVTPRGTVRS